MTVLNGYTLIGDWVSKDAGTSRWGFCTKSGREYFIKEFLEPKYPLNAENLSEKRVEARRRRCDEFYAEKKSFYDALSCCRTGNNVLVEEFFRSGARYYIVTDRVETDGNDPTIISKMSREKKETLLRAILFSVAKLHAAGIVHSDIKPNNILLKRTTGGYYTAKIIDFDAGFLVDKPPEEASGDFVYFSPEAVLSSNGEKVKLTEKIDIFALGILFHEYWTGERPKIGEEYHYVGEAVGDGSEVRLNDSIPLELKRTISRMLSKEPESRPSAREILDGFKTEGSAPTGGDITAPEGSAEQRQSKGFYIPTDLR